MTFLMSISSARRTALLAAALGATTLLGACAPLVVGGAMVVGHRYQHTQQQGGIVVVSLGQARDDPLWDEISRIVTGIGVIGKNHAIIVRDRVTQAMKGDTLVTANNHHGG